MGENVQKQKFAQFFSQKRQQLTFLAAKISPNFRASLIHTFYGNGKIIFYRKRPKGKEETENVPLLSSQLELYNQNRNEKPKDTQAVLCAQEI